MYSRSLENPYIDSLIYGETKNDFILIRNPYDIPNWGDIFHQIINFNLFLLQLLRLQSSKLLIMLSQICQIFVSSLNNNIVK